MHRYLLALLLCQPGVAESADSQQDLIRQGEYLVRAAGCVSCHTDPDKPKNFLAGGRSLQTPFGVFYSPNITSDKKHGVGGWSDEDFERALRQGVSPDGSHYYPVFPYTSYTMLKLEDVKAIAAYLRNVQPVPQANREHELPWYLFRWVMLPWKWLYFQPGEFMPPVDRGEVQNRGAYLVAIGHCSECHTPRDEMGVLDPVRYLSGTKDGPEGESIPNITPHRQTGIGKWDEDDVMYFLKTGALPDGDYTGSLMAEVVDDGTRYLNESDRKAIATYLLALPPVENKLVTKKKKKKKTVKDEW
jgi:mono/diheme cytochrome c family protein